MMVVPEGSTACPPSVSALCPHSKARGLPSVHFIIIIESHCLFAAPGPPTWKSFGGGIVFYLSCSPQNLILRLVRVRCPVDVRRSSLSISLSSPGPRREVTEAKWPRQSLPCWLAAEGLRREPRPPSTWGEEAWGAALLPQA